MQNYNIYPQFLSKEEINGLLNFFVMQKKNHVLSNGMIKLHKPWIEGVRFLIESKLSRLMSVRRNIGDNFFKHSIPYFPHVDNSTDCKKVNVLIPIQNSSIEEHFFIIFDQYVKKNIGITWLGDHSFSGNFKVNKKRNFPFEDQDVYGCTEHGIEESFYSKFLASRYRSRKLFFGLSGVALPWKPGDIIIFSSNQLHCSGAMRSESKIGLSLRFEVES